MHQQPLIIGGGPAGCAAAIRLSQTGHFPIVLERAADPTDKVCGDFLSADTIRQAIALGVEPHSLGAAPIRRVRIVSRTRCAETDLPFPALGLSRRAFDGALLCRARTAGALIRTGSTARHLEHTAGGWSVQAGDGPPVHADTVFLATGKHDLRELPRQRGVTGAVGLKMYYRPAPGAVQHLKGTTELTLLRGAYAGVQPVEDGRIVVCLAVQPDALKQYGGWDGLLAAIADNNRPTARLIDNAEPLLPRPLAIAGVPYGYQAQAATTAGLFRLGDQSTVIPSLAGDGMAIALHSGVSAADAWAAGFTAQTWQRGLAAALAPQMRLAGILHRVALNAPFQPAAIRLAALMPSLLRVFASCTRLPAQAAPLAWSTPQTP